MIPRVHVGASFNLDPAIFTEVMLVSSRFEKRIAEAFSERWRRPVSCEVHFYPKPFLEQSEVVVPGHFHVHLRPRYRDDDLFYKVSRHEKFEDLPRGEGDISATSRGIESVHNSFPSARLRARPIFLLHHCYLHAKTAQNVFRVERGIPFGVIDLFDARDTH